jgi:hypothetical protein
MSVIIVLLPVVYLGPLVVAAAAAALKAAELRSANSGFLNVETRMKNRDLVTASLQDMGYLVHTDGDSLVAQREEESLVLFKNEEDLWVSQFSSGVSEEQAVDRLQELDKAYGKRVQAALVEKIQRRVSDSNMKVVSQQTNQDESVTMTLQVNA